MKMNPAVIIGIVIVLALVIIGFEFKALFTPQTSSWHPGTDYGQRGAYPIPTQPAPPH